MIYQLKISLQHTRPLIWRRLLVHKDMKLVDFHETIQLAFGWCGMHLHCFEARKTNGMSLTNRNISIGTNDENLIDFFEYNFDEREEKLSDWLVREKDKLVYVYDFGDDWRHEIILEKVLNPEPGFAYPYCMKAVRGAAKEDSGGFVEEAEEVDPAELQMAINMNFQSVSKVIFQTATKNEHVVQEQWNRLFHLAKQFNELAPWNWLDDDQIFAVQNPETGDYIYCSVMGEASEEFGLAAFVGEKGLTYLKGILSSPVIDEESIFDNFSLVLSYCNRDELATEDYELIKREGFNFRGKNKWPMFRSMVPGYYPWYFSDEEAKVFSIILECAIDVCVKAKNGLMIDVFGIGDVCFAQSAEKHQGNLIWKDTYVSAIAKEEEEKTSDLLINELDLQRMKSKNKKFNIPLEIGIFHSPNPIQEHPDEKPYFPLVFVAVERRKEMIVFYDLLSAEHREEAMQSAFIKVVESIDAHPRELWMTRNTFLILKPILDRLNITVMQVEKLPVIENVKNSMHQVLG